MAIRESISLSNINEGTFKNSFDVVSPPDPIPEEKPSARNILSILNAHYFITMIVCIVIPLSLWLLSTPILSLSQCTHHLLPLDTMYIQMYNAWCYSLCIVPIWWLILDELQLK